MNLLNPPELADGGYWYVVPAVPDPERGGLTPGEIPGVGWCAWDANVFFCLRSPDPINGMAIADQATVNAALNAHGITGKPYGRVGGS